MGGTTTAGPVAIPVSSQDIWREIVPVEEPGRAVGPTAVEGGDILTAVVVVGKATLEVAGESKDEEDPGTTVGTP